MIGSMKGLRAEREAIENRYVSSCLGVYTDNVCNKHYGNEYTLVYVLGSGKTRPMAQSFNFQ